MISIIVPVYNVERFLPKCIESLISQTYKDIEIILVDDGSPDDCGRICDEYAKKDNRIKVIHQINKGVSAARNVALAQAQGDYIAFCDPDDFCAEDMYEKMLAAMEDSDADLVTCGYDYYNENYQLDKNRSYVIQDNEMMARDDLFRKLADMPPTIRHGVVTKVFRRSLIGTIKFDTDLKSAEDANFLLDYLKHINKAVFVHLPLYNNLVRQGSATHGGLNIKSLKDSFKVHERMYLDTISDYPMLKGHALAFLLDVCTLKYNESKLRVKGASMSDGLQTKEMLQFMRRFICRKALNAIFCKNIYWKTKIYYLLLWIRK